MNEAKPLGYQCCFCGQAIEAQRPRFLTLEVDDGGRQELPCHEECLRRVIHPSVPLAY